MSKSVRKSVKDFEEQVKIKNMRVEFIQLNNYLMEKVAKVPHPEDKVIRTFWTDGGYDALKQAIDDYIEITETGWGANDWEWDEEDENEDEHEDY